MSIKRHLFFYNTISVFTALVVMLLVSGVTTHFTAENYRRQSVASMDVTATIEVQELLQGEEIIRKDWPAHDHISTLDSDRGGLHPVRFLAHLMV